MRSTLFVIPSWIFDGWLLAAWLVFVVIVIGVTMRRHGWGKEVVGFLPVAVVIGLVIQFVLPHLQVTDLDPSDPSREIPIGLPVQGYGVMMLLGIVAGIALAMWRGRDVGIRPDLLTNLCFWVIAAGLVTARATYVIQKHEQFSAETLAESITQIINISQGGLVVYGCLVGGLAVVIVFAIRYQLSVWLLGDIIAPAFAIGLAIGRIGCLMHGCCYGGPCDVPRLGVTFPAGSPPYMAQIEDGQLLGLVTHRPDPAQDSSSLNLEVDSVAPGSLAESIGVERGEHLAIVYPSERVVRAVKSRGMEPENAVVEIYSRDHKVRMIPVRDLPARSLAVHPTQLYDSLNALLIAGVLWFYWPYRRGNGDVLAGLLVTYGISRFLLEVIRVDEVGLAGTPLTLSQWISLVAIAAGLVILARNRLGRGVIAS